MGGVGEVARLQHGNERPARVGLLPDGFDLRGGDAGGGHDNGRGDTAVHRREVGIELHDDRLTSGDAELFFDLGDVAVARNAVSLDGAIPLAKKIPDVGLLTGPRNAAVGIDDQATGLGLHEASPQERHERHLNTRRVATGARDEWRLFPRIVELELGHDITGRGGEGGRWMIVAVVFFVEPEVAEAEVSGKVKDPLTSGDERLGVFCGDPMG